MKEIAKRIKEIRVENKLSQKQFGEALSVSQDTVSLWENGKSLGFAEAFFMDLRACRGGRRLPSYRLWGYCSKWQARDLINYRQFLGGCAGG